MNKILITLILSLPMLSMGQNGGFNADSAQAVIWVVDSICTSEDGRLWGKNLRCPIMFVDRETRTYYADKNDGKGITTGQFPKSKIIANTSMELNGVTYALIGLPLPKKEQKKRILILHEMFHVFQDKTPKMKVATYHNAHMDSMWARVYWKLEMEALEMAFKANKDSLNRHVAAALLFRRKRHGLFAGAQKNEAAFEIHEGIPDYTAYKLVLSPKELSAAQGEMKKFIMNKTSYVRAFGYYAGFLYANVLDKVSPSWRTKLDGRSELAMLLAKATATVEGLEMDEIKNQYNFVRILKEENVRKQKKDSTVAAHIQYFSTDTVHIPLDKPGYGFNPGTLVPLPNFGTYFPFAVITDKWGKLVVKEKGCVLSEQKTIIVRLGNVEVDDKKITSDFWTIELNEGWKMDGNMHFHIK